MYIHLSRQIERLYETARPGQNKAARKEASGEGCAAQNHAMKVTGSSEEADGVQAELSDDFLEQSVQFSQQIVQALSIDLLSAKVSLTALRGGILRAYTSHNFADIGGDEI